MSEPKDRPKRTPLGQRNRLTVSGKDPKFTYRWVNDTDDRIQMAQEAGYEFVAQDMQVGDKRAAEASKMGTKLSKPVGNNTNAFLMRIPKEFYKEDQKAKADQVDALENSLKRPKSNVKTADAKGLYGEGLTND